MAIKLVTKKGNLSLTTGGVPQSEINGLLEEQEKRLEAEYAEQIEGLETEIDTLEAANQELDAENDSLEIQVDTLNTEKEALNTEIGTLNTTIEGLESENNTLEATNQELNAKNDSLELQVGILTTENEVLVTEIGTLNTTIDGLEAEIEELEEDVEFYKQSAIPEEALVISGACNYRFAYGGWDWFIEICGDKITTNDISTATSMFNGSKLNFIPFEMNLSSRTSCDIGNLFNGNIQLLEVPKINGYVGNTNSLFYACNRLREIPEDYTSNWIWDYHTKATGAYTGNKSGMFTNCYSLRKVPHSLLDIANPIIAYGYSYLSGGFTCCYTLDELVDLPIPHTSTWTRNTFSETFDSCSRLKNLTFAMPDGQPYVMQWKAQTIDLSKYVGYAQSYGYITEYNSGITEDKKIGYYYGESNYEELKDDPDAWTLQLEFSRYNHDSAVATINSLPDTSAYLATAGGTNTIKFKRGSGSLTDGGAIGNLTAEEIAVATAKGWTVTFVN